MKNHLNKEKFNVPLEKKLLITLAVLSNTQSFFNVGDKFGISHSTCHYIFKEVVEALAALVPEYIRWPTQDQYNHISSVRINCFILCR